MQDTTPGIVSGDDHILEPPGLFDGRLPAAFIDRTPRVVHRAEGDFWEFDKFEIHVNGLMGAAGRSEEEFSPKATRYDAVRPGCYDPKARLEDMDVDGVKASVAFPNLLGIAGSNLIELEDKDYALALVHAYNNWLAEEWGAPAPDRLWGAAVMPMWDTELCVKEIHRVKDLGLRAVTMSSAPESMAGVASYGSTSWDPVWSAFEETNLPACIHIISGSSRELNKTLLDPSDPAAILAFQHLIQISNQHALSTILFSGAIERHPGLKIVLAESGIGWIPHFLERADYTLRKHRYYTGATLKSPPSEQFASNVWATFTRDLVGIELVDKIGSDRIIFGVDYPHSDTSWPETITRLDEQIAGLSDADRERIAFGNAMAVFGG